MVTQEIVEAFGMLSELERLVSFVLRINMGQKYDLDTKSVSLTLPGHMEIKIC